MALGWRISDENFMRGISGSTTQREFRTSVSQTGNAQIGNSRIPGALRHDQSIDLGSRLLAGLPQTDSQQRPGLERYPVQRQTPRPVSNGAVLLG